MSYPICPRCGDLYLVRKRDRSGYLCVMCGHLFTGRLRNLEFLEIYAMDGGSLPDDVGVQDVAHMVRHKQYRSSREGGSVVMLDGIYSDRRYSVGGIIYGPHPSPSAGPIPIRPDYVNTHVEPLNEYTVGEHTYAGALLNFSGGMSFLSSSMIAGSTIRVDSY